MLKFCICLRDKRQAFKNYGKTFGFPCCLRQKKSDNNLKIIWVQTKACKEVDLFYTKTYCMQQHSRQAVGVSAALNTIYRESDRVGVELTTQVAPAALIKRSPLGHHSSAMRSVQPPRRPIDLIESVPDNRPGINNSHPNQCSLWFLIDRFIRGTSANDKASIECMEVAPPHKGGPLARLTAVLLRMRFTL